MDQDYEKIECDIKALRDRIRARIFTQDKPEGYLTRDEQDYLNCLKIDKVGLDRLFDQDAEHWTESLGAARTNAGQLKDAIKAIMNFALGLKELLRRDVS